MTPENKYCKKHRWYFRYSDICIHCLEDGKKALILGKNAVINYMNDESGGRKFDSGKLRWDLYMFDVAEDVVEILTYGAAKYDPNNWQKVDIERYKAAFMRHYVAWLLGEERDKESGLTHLAHAGCNLMFMAWIEKHKNDDK